MSAAKGQFLDVRTDHATNQALGEITLREGHKWFVLFAVLFFVAGIALLSISTSTARMLGVAALLAAVAVVVYRVRYWNYVRRDPNRLAALGRQRLAFGAGGGGIGVGHGIGLGLGAELGVAAGRGLLDAMDRV